MARTPNWIDLEVALRLKRLRLWRGMTQAELAKALGVSFQQVQKYETGRNRVSISTLMRLSEVLNVSMFDFFPDRPDREPAHLDTLHAIRPEDVAFLRTFSQLDRPVRNALALIASAIPPNGDGDTA